MTSTSGPGLSLMQEVLGLAHMIEVPVVVVNCQRGGPSTGMPTKQEQSDLLAMLYGTHGDTQRILLAPGTPEEAFYDAQLAFNLADKHQCPVMVAMDFSLSIDECTVPKLDRNRIPIDRGALRYRRGSKTRRPRTVSSVPHQRIRHFSEVDSRSTGRSIPCHRRRARDLRLGKRKPEKPCRNGKQARSQSREDRRPGDDLRRRRQSGSVAHRIWFAAGSDERSGSSSSGRWHFSRLAQPARASPFPEKEVALRVSQAKHVWIVEQNANGQLQSIIEATLFRQNQDGTYRYPRVEGFRKYNGLPVFPHEIIRLVKESVEHGSQRQAV